jgi:V/A-type H+-transporting ATPase subunit K
MPKNKKQKTFILYLPIILIVLTATLLIVNAAYSADEKKPAPAAEVIQQNKAPAKSSSWAKYVAAAAAVAFGCISAGIAVGQVGSAAMGAISEKPELFGRALTFVGLSEGIAIWGLIVAILILYA